MPRSIPVSVIIVTRNEEKNLPRCLAALQDFDEVIVVDSESADATVQAARSFGARVEMFRWDGRYPKKRQWCLDQLQLAHDRVFFIDADEEATPEICREITALDWACDGYFVKGAYCVDGAVLRFGLKNSKLCLFDRRTFQFPVLDDINAPGMGEIEGHYQPVPKGQAKIGRLRHALIHYAMQDEARWADRHAGYAAWENHMRKRSAPRDPLFVRRMAKGFFRRLPFRPLAAFFHSYVLLGGFLDGRRGYALARSRMAYYRMQSEFRADAVVDRR